MCSFELQMMDGKPRLKHLEMSYRNKDIVKRCILVVVLWESIFNSTIYEMMWKNNVNPDTPEMTIRRTCAACWITKHTLGICDTCCFSTATMVMRTRLGVTSYVHRVSCYISTNYIANYNKHHHHHLHIRTSPFWKYSPFIFAAIAFPLLPKLNLLAPELFFFNFSTSCI